MEPLSTTITSPGISLPAIVLSALHTHSSMFSASFRQGITTETSGGEADRSGRAGVAVSLAVLAMRVWIARSPVAVNAALSAPAQAPWMGRYAPLVVSHSLASTVET